MIYSTGIKRTLADELVTELGQEIVQGKLRAGEPLPSEDALLARFGVSRTVLREALQVLGAKGLIQARQRRGTSVQPASSWNQLDPALLNWHAHLPVDHPALAQLMEMRRIVEPSAAALAAERATPEDLARIAAAYEGMARAGDDVEAFIHADLEFHASILEATGNPFLLPVAHAIRATLLASLRHTNPSADENRAVSLPLHEAVLRAIQDRDADGAAARMREHLDDTERRRARARRRASADRGARAGRKD